MLNQLFQPQVQQRLSPSTQLQLMVRYCRLTDVNVGVTGKSGAVENGVLQCTQILSVNETRKQQGFLTINCTLALTQRLCMMFVPVAACQYQPF